MLVKLTPGLCSFKHLERLTGSSVAYVMALTPLTETERIVEALLPQLLSTAEVVPVAQAVDVKQDLVDLDIMPVLTSRSS